MKAPAGSLSWLAGEDFQSEVGIQSKIQQDAMDARFVGMRSAGAELTR